MTDIVTIHKSPYIAEQRVISKDQPVMFYKKDSLYPITHLCNSKKEFDIYNNDPNWKIAEKIYGW